MATIVPEDIQLVYACIIIGLKLSQGCHHWVLIYICTHFMTNL